MSHEGQEELLDYSDSEEIAVPTTTAPSAAAGEGANDKEADKKGSYVGIHATGFRDFLLKPELLRAIGDCGFEHPSEVQQVCIPQSILGTDVLCQAKSGLGKTAVFVLSTLQQLDPVPGEISTLVICHTRELAYQIRNEYSRFSKYMPDVKTEVFYGGTPITRDLEKLKNKDTCPHIVVATPGRLHALVTEKSIRLNNIKSFVIDECDKVLEAVDMRRDVQDIFRNTPHQKQVMMFSATLSQEIRPVCKKFMQNPLEIYVDDEAKLTLHGLQQYYIKLDEKEKNRKLSDLLDSLEFNQVIIFVRSTQRANELNKLLCSSNFPSIAVHSGLPQEERIERYKSFKEFNKRICVSTDVFGRGIDIERINLAINYDLPNEADQYLHRVGRAGRFGTKGLAVSLVSTKDDEVLEQAEKTIQELSDRLVSLESELNQLQTDEVNTPESSSTFCSAHPNAFVTGHTDDQASSDSNSASGVEEHAKTNGGPKVDHPQTNGSVAHPQPPPEPPSVDNFKFTSTPNPVFLSRGKLHHKVKGNKSADASPTKNPSSESVVDGEDFQKSKKQRVVPDELIQQKKLLRKIIMPTGQSTKKGAANQSVEEDDGSLSTLMKNALKRKFANVDLNSFNDSHASEETTITEFSI